LQEFRRSGVFFQERTLQIFAIFLFEGDHVCSIDSQFIGIGRRPLVVISATPIALMTKRAAKMTGSIRAAWDI
jgi:hypothetical protein